MRSPLCSSIVCLIAIGTVCVQTSRAQGMLDSLQPTNTSWSGDSPEEIVVTAEMRTQNIQDVALPVTAVGGETLRDLGIDTSCNGTQSTSLRRSEISCAKWL
jgi:outer membrane receptor protein involved in Fe transport